MKWGVISLGKGFYEFTFSSLEDTRRVRSLNSVNLNPGFMKLFACTIDFNPSWVTIWKCLNRSEMSSRQHLTPNFTLLDQIYSPLPKTSYNP